MAAVTTPTTARATLVRASGACLILAGALISGAVTHPDILDTSFATAALDASWPVWHALWLVATVLMLAGLAGLSLRHEGRWGALGTVGLLLAIPGLVLTACAAFFEAFVMPEIARADPTLLEWDGPLLSSWGLRLAGGLALAWPVGLCFVGLAVWRARLLPRGAAALLTIGGPGFAALGGPFVPVLGDLSVLVLAAAHLWLGWALWVDPSSHPAASGQD